MHLAAKSWNNILVIYLKATIPGLEASAVKAHAAQIVVIFNVGQY